MASNNHQLSYDAGGLGLYVAYMWSDVSTIVIIDDITHHSQFLGYEW